MLVLTRKINEEIQLGRDVKITVLAIDPERVKIGISAPKDMGIYRMELLEETKRVNQEAALLPMVDLTKIVKINK